MYAPFYNLVAEPFQLTPDHRFFFASTVHNQALAHLTYGLNQGEGFIVITGDIGAGKTTLVSHLLATLDSRKYVAAKVVTTQLGADDLLRSVITTFGVKADLSSKADMLRQLEAFFTFSHRSGKRCLLLIDEAQNLSPTALEELRMLSNFQVGERAPLQSFILGQPQFRAVLNSPELEQLRQRIIANYHLGPLDVPETQSYIEHRLHTAGWKSDPSLAPDVFAAVHHHTEGVPRRINNLCNRLFLYGFLEEKRHFEASDVERVARDLTREENPDIRGKDLVGLPRDRGSFADGGSVDPLRQRIDPIEQRQAPAGDTRLVEELRRRLDLIEEYVRLRAMADRSFEDLVRRVAAVEDAAAKTVPAAGPELDERLAATEAKLESLANVVDAERLNAVESRLVATTEELASRLHAIEGSNASPGVAPEMAQRLAAIESLLQAVPPHEEADRMAAVDARLASIPPNLDERLGSFEAAQARDRAAWVERCQAIERQLAEAAKATKFETGGGVPTELVAELNALADRVKGLEQRKGGADGDALSTIETRLRKLEHKPVAAPAEGLDLLQQRIASIEATQSAAAALAGTVTELTSRLEGIDTALRGLPRNGALQDLAPRLAAIEDALSTHQTMLRRAIGLAAGLLERGRSRELRDAS